MMRNGWKIFTQDIKSICTNWVAAIIIAGLIILPSLYAWFNIKASWDPYGQTGQIPIGVVNEDKGAEVRGKKIEVGDELVQTLKNNKKMGWRFVNREKAMEKLKYGDYYAVIVIPENFSKRLATVISKKPQKAEIDYYVNEKINAIAPKITEKGASVIVQQISSNFISLVNKTIFDIFNELGIELQKDLPDIKKFESYLFTIESNLPEIYQLLNDTTNDANRASQLIIKAKTILPQVKEATNKSLRTIDDTSQFIDQAEARLDEMKPIIEQNIAKIIKLHDKTNELIQNIDLSTIPTDKEQSLSRTIIEKNESIGQAIETIETTLNNLKDLNQTELPELNEALSSLDNVKGNYQVLKNQAEQLDTLIRDHQNEIDKFFKAMKGNAESIKGHVEAFAKDYRDVLEPFITKTVGDVKSTLTEARNILTEIQSTLPEVQGVLNRTDKNLSEGREMLTYVTNQFPFINDKVIHLADKLRKIKGETDINEIIDLLQHDPESEKNFFAEPVKLKENSVFSIPNYGTGMTPFYTVLAIWVGGLLLISLISTDIHHTEGFKTKEIYIGRLLTFLSIGFLQSIIVTLGDIFILHVKLVEPFWFVLFGIFCSVIFITIVYTLVSVFGDVGKALAIIMLVLQIAGSGGTYPVVLLPEFFQKINPFLPFTYAIDTMREATGGILWRRVGIDLLYLLIFGLFAFIFGGYLKNLINEKTKSLRRKAKESGIFH